MRTDDLRMCDCAGCGAELLGESMRPLLSKAEKEGYRFVRGRISGRPYCDDCLASRRPPPGRGPGGDPSPWLENAVRALEEVADGDAG